MKMIDDAQIEYQDRKYKREAMAEIWGAFAAILQFCQPRQVNPLKGLPVRILKPKQK